MSAKVQWLSADEAAAWMPLLTVALWLPGALDAQLEQDFKISNFEYGVLAQISMQPGRRAQLSALARSANGTLPRLSKVLGKLQRQGWVEKFPDPENGRATIAALTDAGWALVQAAAPGHVTRVRELVFDHLSAEQVHQLAVIAGTLADAIGVDGASAHRFGG